LLTEKRLTIPGDQVMTSKTRPSLLEQLRDGGPALAWDEFFQRYWPLVYSFARRRGCSEHSAEEIVQEVMLKVFSKRDVFQYDPSRGRFRDWLGVLVRNQVAEYYRRPAQRIRPPGAAGNGSPREPPSTEPTAEQEWERAFENSLLLALLDVVRCETNPRDYLAFELVSVHGMRAADVAKVTGLSRNVVYKTQRKVFKRLRQLAGSYGDDGRLSARIEDALQMQPEPRVQRSVTLRVGATRGSR
jgi:RNA polymerase sigma-70 factor (ECF subfamily)